jgi:hypothetical protein
MLVLCWLIASESDGELPALGDLAFRLRITLKQLNEVIIQLSPWLEQNASKALAECKQHAMPETETETETEKNISLTSFAEFWSVYPKRVGRRKAEAIYGRAIAKREVTPEALIAGAKRYAAECAGKEAQYIAHPATWLNAGRWADETIKPNPAIGQVRTFNGDPEKFEAWMRTEYAGRKAPNGIIYPPLPEGRAKAEKKTAQ